jgi:endonuclease/exonuclease/phosphatase family metal-dependent hydrolase
MKLTCAFTALLMLSACNTQDANIKPNPSSAVNNSIRFATYNTSLYTETSGGLISRLQKDDNNAKKIAAVIQYQKPDVLLLNEFDYDAEGIAANIFQKNYLAIAQDGQAAINYPHRYFAPVNTGVQSGMDLDNNGTIGGEGRSRGNDAYGYGLHPGQYGMLVLSKFPIDDNAVRTFQNLLWKDLPNAIQAENPTTKAAWYSDEVWKNLRLSSKSHWDVPIATPNGIVHFLVSHPTPPVFDGPEDRNGARNHDEIKLWADYLDNKNADWLCDDKKQCGGLNRDARFVIAGDLNADPMDGDGINGTIKQLLDHPRVLKHAAPRSKGAVTAAQLSGGANLEHRGEHAEDTGDFGPKVGNMRLDYVLPSANMTLKDSGVFWQSPDEIGSQWMDASDHHMVWLDLSF